MLAQLESGVEVNHANASGDTALTYAAFMGHAEVVALLEKEGNVNASGLAAGPHCTSRRNAAEKIVEQLIAKGAEINALTEEVLRDTARCRRCNWRNCSETRGKDRRCAEVMPLGQGDLP